MSQLGDRREALMEKLNALCQPDEQYTLIRHPRDHRTETAYIHHGYYLVYLGSREEWQPATRWPDHAGEGHYLGTTAAEAFKYLRKLLRERQSGQSTQLPTAEEEAE